MDISFSELRRFVAPEYLFGIGSRYQTGKIVSNIGCRKVLLVTDPGVEEAGWASPIQDSLKEANIDFILFDNISPNPRDYEVSEGVEVYLKHGCDGIVVIGGGSAIDCAKGIAIVASEMRSILEFEGVDLITVPLPPVICLPTTAGSAADVSQFAIITDSAQKKKIAIISKAIIPDISIVDPEVSTTMSPDLTANTGLDVLVHAIEATVSNAGSPITDIHSLEAIRLVKRYLPAAFKNPQDLQARSFMMLASLEAGLAFSNASLGAVHAMAHSLGGLVDAPHGECNALLLKHVINFNYDSAESEYLNVARALGVDITDKTPILSSILGEIDSLLSTLTVTNRLRDLGVKPEIFSQLALTASLDPCIVTNPKKASTLDLERIYESAF